MTMTKILAAFSWQKTLALKSIPKIILTGFPTYEVVRDTISPVIGELPVAIAFLGKKEGPEAMIQAVEKAFSTLIKINQDLEIHWDNRGLFKFSVFHLPD